MDYPKGCSIAAETEHFTRANAESPSSGGCVRGLTRGGYQEGPAGREPEGGAGGFCRNLEERGIAAGGMQHDDGDTPAWARAMEKRLQGQTTDISELEESVDALRRELGRQKRRGEEPVLAHPSNKRKLDHIDAVEANLDAMLTKVGKIWDAIIGNELRVLIEEGKRLHTEEKQNILISDRFSGNDFPGIPGNLWDFDENDFAGKRSGKAQKLAAEFAAFERKIRLDAQGHNQLFAVT